MWTSGNGQAGGWRGDPVARPDGQSQPAAHGDAFHQRHDGFRKPVQPQVKGILNGKELVSAFRLTLQNALPQPFHISASAETARAGTTEYQDVEVFVGSNFIKERIEPPQHVRRQDVDDLWPVERHNGQPGVLFQLYGFFSKHQTS
jgi:hypothetical protein